MKKQHLQRFKSITTWSGALAKERATQALKERRRQYGHARNSICVAVVAFALLLTVSFYAFRHAAPTTPLVTGEMPPEAARSVLKSLPRQRWSLLWRACSKLDVKLAASLMRDISVARVAEVGEGVFPELDSAGYHLHAAYVCTSSGGRGSQFSFRYILLHQTTNDWRIAHAHPY